MQIYLIRKRFYFIYVLMVLCLYKPYLSNANLNEPSDCLSDDSLNVLKPMKSFGDNRDESTCNTPYENKEDSLAKIRASFILVDAPPRLSTMRQYNQNYLGAYTFIADKLYKSLNYRPASFILIGFTSILGYPLTHEEGHRSVLTYKNIGSVSHPYFDKNLTASVQGVTDEALIELRNSDLPNYIRLHTAGLESDYMLADNMESQMVFDSHHSKLLYFEYFLRRTGVFQYYLMGLIGIDIDIKEDDDELKRDIVGHDVYGAIRHLHRPEDEFYRYIRFDDLTKDELKMVRRAGWRSFMNLVSPLLFQKQGFKLSSNVAMNLSLGYTMSPFGDFMNQNIWLKIDNQLIGVYLRQHQNKQTWFPAAGASVYNLGLPGKFFADLGLHIWQQPENLSFIETNGFWGGALDATLRYRLSSQKLYGFNDISFDLGIVAKTKGFMPEEMHLGANIGGRFGFSLYY